MASQTEDTARTGVAAADKKPKNWLDRIFEGYTRFVVWLTWVSLVLASIMVLVMVYNIAGRYLFKAPLSGTLEMIELSIVVVVFCVVAYTEVRRSHVRVEVLVSRFPTKVQTVLESIMKLIAAAFFGLITWQTWLLMWSRLFPKVSRTDLLSIPIGPFMGVISFGAALLSIQLLIHCYQGFASLKSPSKEK